MTTKTNFEMVKELNKVYTPKQRGIALPEEIKLIENTLQLKFCTMIELNNIRDFVVLFYGHSEDMVNWDRMSAITYIIDSYKNKLGEF